MVEHRVGVVQGGGRAFSDLLEMRLARIDLTGGNVKRYGAIGESERIQAAIGRVNPTLRDRILFDNFGERVDGAAVNATDSRFGVVVSRRECRSVVHPGDCVQRGLLPGAAGQVGRGVSGVVVERVVGKQVQFLTVQAFVETGAYLRTGADRIPHANVADLTGKRAADDQGRRPLTIRARKAPGRDRRSVDV